MADDFAARPLSGTRLLAAGIVLALANFMVVLDTTVANVSVPHISGGLGVSPTQGTWVVTSYSVAEAICVPLTGWLVRRFGTVRIYMTALIGFAFFSALCGLASSIGAIVAFRIGQGLCGGPIMPLTQTLLLTIFPPEKRAGALGAWAMTTVTAPIFGPILGGLISDNWSWPWIFYINLPIAVLCIVGLFVLLRRSETKTEIVPVDRMGLVLMVVWIAALQIMLDLGREHNWLDSTFIAGCAIIAVIGFVTFVIWEITAAEPIVNLRVFRHRGFSVSVAALSFSFGTFFASVVIIPQWLQSTMGYTAADAGYVTAFNGVLAVIFSPIAARLTKKVDPRALVCFGICWLGLTSTLRTFWFSGADFRILALPQFVQGLGMPFFFVPLTIIALGAVDPEETASAAGIMSFLRTLAAAVGTAIGSTLWQNDVQRSRAELVNVLNNGDQVIADAMRGGMTAEQGRGMIDRLVEQESFALATTHLFALAAVIFFASAAFMWLAPRPPKKVESTAAH